MCAELDEGLVRNSGEIRVREVFRLIPNGLHNPRMRVANSKTTPAASEIDELIAIDIHDQGALALSNVERSQRCKATGDELLP